MSPRRPRLRRARTGSPCRSPADFISPVGALRRCSGTGSATSVAARLGGRAVGAVDGVALRRGRQIDRRLRQRGVAFGHAEEVHRILRRHRDRRAPADRRCRCPPTRSGRAAARRRAGPRPPRASAPASRPPRPDRCCASTCAAPRSGCSAPRRSCRRGARGSGRVGDARRRRCRPPAARRRRRRAPACSARRARRRWRSARSPASASSSDAERRVRRGRVRDRPARAAGS